MVGKLSQYDGDTNMPTFSNKNTQYGSQSAIHIRDVYKRYTKDTPILQGLNMNVEKGTIYGLLGASGCGKSTLLSSIVGLTNLESGSIQIFGREMGPTRNTAEIWKLGYMPQELALHNQLTIKEIMEFYGSIYNVAKREIVQRRRFLNKLLEFPDNSKLVGDLSGGQQRRVSLSLALIHSPDILVLDEPTVGLDPLIRNTIWAYFQEIVSNLGVTILLSTHYIEEARLSTTIGIMRKGRLIAEDQPLNILRNSNTESLEKAVLQLCRQNERNLQNTVCRNKPFESNTPTIKECRGPQQYSKSSCIDVSQDIQYPIIKRSFNSVVDFHTEMASSWIEISKPKTESQLIPLCINMSQRVFGLSFVIIKTLIRNKILLMALLSMSIIQGSLYLVVFGSMPKGITIGVVNHDRINSSLSFESGNISQSNCDMALQSSKYLNIADDNHLITLVHFDNEEDALLQVRLGRSYGYLSFPENFSSHTFDLLTHRQFALNESIRGSRIHAYIDESAFVKAFLITNHLQASYMEYLKKWAISCNIESKQLELPLHYRPPIYGTYADFGILNFLIPGVIIYSTMLALSVDTAIILISDRKQGTFSRLGVAGMSTADIVVSYLVSQGIAVTSTIIIIDTLVLHVAFGFVIKGYLWLYLFIFLLAGLCGTAIGLLVGIICKDEAEGVIILFCLYINFLLSGGPTFPLEDMSIFWRRLAYILPVTQPILAIRSIIVRGLGLLNLTVWPGLLALILWIVGLLIIVVIIARKS